MGAEFTSFTLDNMGRYLCNSLREALDSANVNVAGHSREFDVIIVGGGSFGCAMAEALFARDTTRSRRILVLEQGPFVLPEHQQNMPFLDGLLSFRKPWVNDPALDAVLQFPGLLYAIGGRSLTWGGWGPEPLHDNQNDELVDWPNASITDLQGRYFLRAAEDIGVGATNDFIYGPLHEGLRRQLLDGLRAGVPPGLILADLPDHPIVRNYRRDHAGADPPASQLREWLGLPPTDPTPAPELLQLLRLEAPLAIQSATEAGVFPFNKFSAIPLAIEAERLASVEADGVGAVADARKRLVIVPDWHVQELLTQTQPDNWVRVNGVRVVNASGATFDIGLAPQQDGTQGVAILALGTIENTRVALTTFQGSLAGRAAQRMGENLIAHLRSNLTIRVPKRALTKLPAASVKHLQTSALFVKGKARIRNSDRYFHIQITAAGLSDMGNNSEAFLFKKIPDAELLQAMTEADSTSVVITLRAIGQMSSFNPDNRVGLAQTPGDVDFFRPAAYVNIGNALAAAGGSQQTQDDRDLWAAMDDFTDRIALIFANGQPFEILTNRLGKVIPVPAGATAQTLKQLRLRDNAVLQQDIRDRLGTTHHEAGTMRMSVLPADGVTNDYGRIHDTNNCYVVGPALCPTTGSTNPMLTGIALVHRTADLLTTSVLRKPTPFSPAPPWRALFDGTGMSFNRWLRVSPGASNGFTLLNGEIATYGGGDFGLLYYAAEAFADFTLRVQFRLFDPLNQNSGIFVRFRDPLLDPPQAILDRIRNERNEFRQDLNTDFQNYQNNRAWSAVHSGFEIQIDDNATGDPRRGYYGSPEPSGVLNKNRTGAIYKIPAGDFIPNSTRRDATLQNYQAPPRLVMNRWYEFEIDVRGNDCVVDLTDLQTGTRSRTTAFSNTDAVRGSGIENQVRIGYIGLQSYPNSPVAFRNIQIRP